MIRIEIKDQEVLEALQRLQAAGADMTRAMADIAQALASESERQFRDESGPGGPWPDLAASTKAARARRGKWPGKMLQVSAAGLAVSLQTGYDAQSAWIGSNKPYAAIQALGGQAGRGRRTTIPARMYLPVDPETGDLSGAARQTVMEVLRGHLARALHG